MPDISVKGQIKKLVELQKIDGEIYALKKQLAEKPQVVEELKQSFESGKTRLHALEEKLKSIQLARKEKELDLKTKEDQIAKANSQLNEVKTNKEYTAKLSEIESLKADKSVFEEKILEFYDEADKVLAEIEKEKVIVSGEEKRFQAKKQEVDGDIKTIEGRIKELEGQRSVVADIETNVKQRYEKLLQHKQGLAIVPITSGHSCGGCYMNVPNQVVNQIKMNEELVVCEMCQRILYLEEDL